MGSMSARYAHDDSDDDDDEADDDDDDVSPSVDVDKPQRKHDLYSRLSAGLSSSSGDPKSACISAKNGSQTDRLMSAAPVVHKLKLGGLPGKVPCSDVKSGLSTGSVVCGRHHGHHAVTSTRRRTDEHAAGQRKWV